MSIPKDKLKSSTGLLGFYAYKLRTRVYPKTGCAPCNRSPQPNTGY
jgi:hypothetical protein